MNKKEPLDYEVNLFTDEFHILIAKHIASICRREYSLSGAEVQNYLLNHLVLHYGLPVKKVGE